MSLHLDIPGVPNIPIEDSHGFVADFLRRAGIGLDRPAGSIGAAIRREVDRTPLLCGTASFLDMGGILMADQYRRLVELASLCSDCPDAILVDG